MSGAFSDCTSVEKYWRVPPGNTTGTGIALARARIKASTKGRML
jgi:hypothetical protein